MATKITSDKAWNVGFLINEIVVEQHADELELDWVRRNRAATAPHYKLNDLGRLDELIEAHLDALMLARDVGWNAVEALGFDEDGLTFTGTVLAVLSGDPGRLEQVLCEAIGDVDLERGVISAFGWLPFAKVASQLRHMLTSQSPAVQRIAIAAFGIHRQDPGIFLQQAVGASDVALQARALKVCGELGRRDLSAELAVAIRSTEESVRFQAAWSLARLGVRSGVVLDCLRDIALAKGPYAEQAVVMRVRHLDIATAKAWCRSLRESEDYHRLGLIGMGVVGDPELLPEILASTQIEEVARVAGASFADIVGIDLDYEDLDGDDPLEVEMNDDEAEVEDKEDEEDENSEAEVEDDDSDDLSEKDDDLVWPHTERAFAWLQQNRSRFTPGIKYFVGAPMTKPSLDTILRKGTQRQREMAATELGIQSPASPLFPVRANALLQKQLLATWTS